MVIKFTHEPKCVLTGLTGKTSKPLSEPEISLGEEEPREISIRSVLAKKAGRPLGGQRHLTLTAMKPWGKESPPVSRRTWYRRQKKES